MRYKTVISATLLAISMIIPMSLAQADVVHQQFGEDNLFVRVSNDSWQPDYFVNGVTLPTTYLKHAGITLDGKENEIAWSRAHELVVPLEYGTVKEASIKALYTDENVFIRVRWADATEDRDHHPWVWNAEIEDFEIGPQIEDSVLLSFEAGCEWTPSLLSGYSYDFDVWHWLAARSDPVDQAWDLYGSTWDQNRPGWEHTAYKSRNTENLWNLKFKDNDGILLTGSWDETDRSYNFRKAKPIVYLRTELDRLHITDASETVPAPLSQPDNKTTFPQFRAVKLQGDAGEISAKGHWEEGYWTVEFRRILETPAQETTDVVFNRITQFSVHIFDHVEAVDKSSESGRLFLRFLPKPGLIVQE